MNRAREEFDYVLHHMRHERQERADLLRLIRKTPRKALDRWDVNAAIRTMQERNPNPPKPNRAYFRRQAIAVLREAIAPLPWEVARRNGERWVNPCDTETYSACGYEDGLAMAKDDAREYAPVCVGMYRIAVQELKS